MRFRLSRNFVAATIVLVAAALVAIISSVSRREPEGRRTLTVQFGWLPDAHHSGFWVALDKGFYREEGLDVRLLPGGLDSSPIKAVVSGVADIGQAGGLEQLITARCEGLPIRAFAAFHRDTPHALISLERKPIRSARDLPGKTVAIAYGDAAELLFRAFLEKSGVSMNEIHPVPFRFDLTPLMHGDVDAITGFATDQPATLKSKGFTPVVLSYSKLGVRSYGYTFFTSERTLGTRKRDLEAFIRASRKGWQYAIEHPDEAVKTMLRYYGESLTSDVESEKLSLVRKLMCDPNGTLADWRLARSRVEEVIARMKSQGILKTELTYDDLVDEGGASK